MRKNLSSAQCFRIKILTYSLPVFPKLTKNVLFLFYTNTLHLGTFFWISICISSGGTAEYFTLLILYNVKLHIIPIDLLIVMCTIMPTLFFFWHNIEDCMLCKFYAIIYYKYDALKDIIIDEGLGTVSSLLLQGNSRRSKWKWRQ